MTFNFSADSSSLDTDSASVPPVLRGLESQVRALRDIGHLFYGRGWSVGTSSNYSVVVNRDPLELLVTASGKDKGRLDKADFVRVGDDGLPSQPGQPKSSAETLLHVAAAQRPDVGAVLHTHSVWGTLLSDLYFDQGGFEIEDYEMLKGLSGIRTHQSRAWVKVFDNTQDMRELAELVDRQWDHPDHPLGHGYLIRRHGLYTWGRDLDEARRHIEIFEFLFECVGRRLHIESALPPST